MKSFKNKIKNMKGITLISLVITIIVLIILAGVTLNMLLGENGIINRTKTARDENEKATATETMNLRITNVQISKYAEEQRMPTLKELADNFCEDDDFQYVQETSEVASLTKITNNNPTSIYTKLKAYPYEFEINSSLQLASIDGVKIASESTNNSISNNNSEVISNVTFSSEDITNSSITINITATTNNNSNIIGYHVFCIKDLDNNIKKIRVDENNVITISGLEKLTKYNIYVVAYDENNKEKVSNIQSITTKNELLKNPAITEATKNNVITSKEQGSNLGWKAFDGTPSTGSGNYWCDDDNAPAYIGLDFESEVSVRTLKYKNYSSGADGLYTGKIQYSYDGSTWIDSIDGIFNGERTTDWQTVNVTDGVNARYWRLYIITNGGVQWTALQEVEMYYF